MTKKTLAEYAEAFEEWAEKVDAADLREADTAAASDPADRAEKRPPAA